MPDVKKRIADVLDGLPEHRQAEVLDFAEFLQSREQRSEPAGPTALQDLFADPSREEPPLLEDPFAEDPLTDYVGGVEHGRLAQGIDGELYGA